MLITGLILTQIIPFVSPYQSPIYQRNSVQFTSKFLTKYKEMSSYLPYTCQYTQELLTFLPRAKAFVFDFDGTLLDTMPNHFKSFTDACNEVGLQFTQELFYQWAGIPERVIWKNLMEQQVQVNYTIDECVRLKRKFLKNIEDNSPKVKLIENVVAIAKEYYGKIPMAVASSGWKDHVVKHLEEAGIRNLFDHIVTIDDEEVQKPKPEPDMFKIAAQRLKVSVEDCVGFEDANFGLIAIEKAGYLYSCDVRKLFMYPRNIEKRESRNHKTIQSG